MTNDEAKGVAIWAVTISQEYKVTTQKVVDVFRALYEFNKDIADCKNTIEQSLIGKKGEEDGQAYSSANTGK